MTYPDPFSICFASVPIIVYLFVLGILRISGRAVVTKGTREIAALGFAVVGLVAVGPAQLFFPQAAGTVFEWKVWLMLGAFYVLCVTLISLTTRPKISIVGRTGEEAFPAIIRATQMMDPLTEVDERKQQLFLPSKSIRLRLETIPGIDHVSVVAFEPRVSNQFWKSLSIATRREIRSTRATTSGRGVGMIASAAALVVLVLYQFTPGPERLVEGFRQWLLHQ